MSQPELNLDPNEIGFMQRLKEHPELPERFAVLLAVVENADGDSLTADEAEQRVIEELRQLGQRALQAWAERKQQRVEVAYARLSDVRRKEKKSSTGRHAAGG